jgi:thiol-disulfide isomerase/thioredoxin
LAGKECQCFPIIKRAINPLFFAEDGVLLLMALVASVWSPSVRRLRVPAVAFITLVVFAGTSFGINAKGRVKEVPSPIIADGKPDDVTKGKVLIFFYDPSCEHCDAAARFMSKLKWNGARIVSIPTVNPQWAASFLHDTHLRAETSLELDRLKKAFPFGDPPYGIAVEDGHVKERFGPMQFTPPQPEQQLRTLGFIQ